MTALVYVLCLAASTLCAWLLIRSYLRTRVRLLLWSAVSFVCLATNNFFVVADILFWPDANLLWLRYAAAFGAVCATIYGFIWEGDDAA